MSRALCLACQNLTSFQFSFKIFQSQLIQTYSEGSAFVILFSCSCIRSSCPYSLPLRPSRSSIYSGFIQSLLLMFKQFKRWLIQTGHAVRWGPDLAKARSYKNADITSQFKELDKDRKRKQLILDQQRELVRKKLLEQKIKVEEDSKLIGEMSSQLAQTQQNLQTLRSLRGELKLIDEGLEQQQANYTVLEGQSKQFVLIKIQYFRFQYNLLKGQTLHPEHIKIIDNIHYLVSNNLPVHRYKLYQLAPEFFQAEINQLQQAHRQLMEKQRIRLSLAQSNVGSFTNNQLKYKLGKPKKYIQLQDQVNKMQLIYHQLEQQFLKKHEPITKAKESKGFVGAFLRDHIILKDSDKRSQEQQQFVKDYLKLQQQQENILQYIKLTEKQMESQRLRVDLPQYVENHPLLKKFVTDKIEEAIANQLPEDLQFRKGEIAKTLPDFIYKLFEEEGVNLDKLREECREEYKKIITGEFYDESLITEQIIRHNPKFLKAYEIFEKIEEKGIQEAARLMEIKQRSTPALPNIQKALIPFSHLPKLLYLNNEDPEKYNLQFWSKQFGLEESELREALSKLSYAITQPNSKLLRVLKFKQL